MSLPKIKDIKNLSIKEIDTQVEQLKIEILNLKIQKSAREAIKPHVYKHKKHQLAQLLTVKTQKIKLSIEN